MSPCQHRKPLHYLDNPSSSHNTTALPLLQTAEPRAQADTLCLIDHNYQLARRVARVRERRVVSAIACRTSSCASKTLGNKPPQLQDLLRTTKTLGRLKLLLVLTCSLQNLISACHGGAFCIVPRYPRLSFARKRPAKCGPCGSQVGS